MVARNSKYCDNVYVTCINGILVPVYFTPYNRIFNLEKSELFSIQYCVFALKKAVKRKSSSCNHTRLISKVVQQLLNEVWHCSLLHQIRCLQLAKPTGSEDYVRQLNVIDNQEPYPRCPSDWSRGGAKDQCSAFSRFPSLSLSEIQPMYIQFTTVLHRSAECWLYVLSLPTELRVQDAFSYEWLLCACASCMLTISVIRATLVDSVCLCVCALFILRFSHVRPLFIPMSNV